MINNPANYIPVQHAAVQQQFQQNQVPVQQPVPVQPQIPAEEFNAIKINISGATVGAPGQPQFVPQNAYALPPQVGQNINYVA